MFCRLHIPSMPPCSTAGHRPFSCHDVLPCNGQRHLSSASRKQNITHPTCRASLSRRQMARPLQAPPASKQNTSLIAQDGKYAPGMVNSTLQMCGTVPIRFGHVGLPPCADAPPACMQRCASLVCMRVRCVLSSYMPPPVSHQCADQCVRSLPDRRHATPRCVPGRETGRAKCYTHSQRLSTTPQHQHHRLCLCLRLPLARCKTRSWGPPERAVACRCF